MKAWLADYVWREGVFESGVAMFADSSGRITHFSSAAADLAQADAMSPAGSAQDKAAGFFVHDECGAI